MAKIRWSATALGNYVSGLITLAYDKGPGPDIVGGLEAAFYYLFSFAQWSGGLPVILRFGRNTQVKKEALRLLSYFNEWAPIFDGYNSARKVRWRQYWETLPFGTHAGLHGYPGSGFSALVYLNAWRVKTGKFFLNEPFSMYLTHGDLSIDIASVAYSPTLSIFVASGTRSGDGGVYYSYDGINWDFTVIATPALAGKIRWIAGPDIFLFSLSAAGVTGLYMSSDGINWTVVGAYTDFDTIDVAFSPVSGNYCITGATGTGAAMLYGPSLTSVSRIANTDFVSGSWIVYSQPLNLFVAFAGFYPDLKAFVSVDGETWTEVAALPGFGWNDLIWSDTLACFVACGGADGGYQTATSSDGYTWNISAIYPGRLFTALADSPALGYVFMTDYAEHPTGVVYSDDGLIWYDVQQQGLANSNGIAASGSMKLLAVGGLHSRGYSQGRLYGII